MVPITAQHALYKTDDFGPRGAGRRNPSFRLLHVNIFKLLFLILKMTCYLN